MSFIWPLMLFLLALMPVCALLYVNLQRQRRIRVANAGSLGFAQQAGGRPLGRRRHIPPILFLAGLTILTFALSRPQAVVSLPRLAGTVVLTFDVSGSMAATDVAPTRMEAAKAAARAFVERQPTTVQIGVVAFSESGLAVQVPTNDRDVVLGAINRLSPSNGTSLATGIQASLAAITALSGGPATNYYSNRIPDPNATPVPPPKVPGNSAAIVLITDGENTVSPDPMLAAQAAAEQGVRIHTVGIGSPEGTTLKLKGFSVHTKLDEAALQAISQLTDGQYYNAQDADSLQSIYQNLGAQLVVKPQETEITVIVAGVGLVVLLLGGLLSMAWLSRLP